MKTHQKSTLQLAAESVLIAACLLLIPLIAMQFNKSFDWSLFDFIAAWILLFVAGFSYKLLARKYTKFVSKIAIGLTVFTGLFLIWSNLAVGIIGNENNPVNLYYFGVLAVLIIGTIKARFRLKNMVYALYATAIAQVLVTIIAFISGQQYAQGSSATEILMVNAFFIFFWIISALLFEYASQQNNLQKLNK